MQVLWLSLLMADIVCEIVNVMRSRAGRDTDTIVEILDWIARKATRYGRFVASLAVRIAR